MILELIVLILAWAGLGVIITLIFGAPLFFSIPLAFLSLIVYDFMARPESELNKEED